jgi:2-amino-4-hydroxy-6-hydroxymethyldihydropteridine diphosphokinase
MKKAYLSLGANLGDRERQIETALDLLQDARLNVTRRSPLYETEPRDVAGQPWFINMCAEIETTYFPMMLMNRILRVERSMGRRRTAQKGPRVIDIDIVFYGRFVVGTPRLTVPHPRMHERRFVLEPLAALVPDLRHPVTKRTVREMLAAVQDQPLRKVMP